MIKVNLVADMDCDRCGRPAIISQPYSGLSLCTRHLIEDIRRKGKKTVRSHSWLRPGDRIAIAVPGDLQSIALLDFMRVLVDGRKDVSIFAIMPGNYQGMDPSFGISCIFPPGNGGTIPEEERFPERRPGSSHPFGTRNETERFFASVAKENKATALAMPYSLLDHAEWALWKVLNGEVPGSTKNNQKTGYKFRIIRPFMHVPAEELIIYARAIEGDYYPGTPKYIPYVQEGSLISRLLTEFGRGHPSAQFALVNIWDDLVRSAMQAACEKATGER